MGLLGVDFSRGVVAISEVYEAEVARQREAAENLRAYRQRDLGVPPDMELRERLYAALDPERPVWWKITGIHPWRGEAGLSERRAGIQNLLIAVEDMYRAELSLRPARMEAHKEECGPEERNPQSPYFYDPLREICHFLQLPLSKLSELCLEQTGLRIQELGDAIRADDVRAKLKETFGPLVVQWEATLDEKALAKLADQREKAWVFLQWVRGRGRAGNRKKLAWGFGIPSAARLNKAVYQNNGITLEDVELEVAMELMGVDANQGVVLDEGDGAQGAELSDLGGSEDEKVVTEGVEPDRGDAPRAGLSDVGEGSVSVMKEGAVSVGVEAA